MSDTDTDDRKQDLLFEYQLDAPPEKVWRALSIGEFRRRWLPDSDLADDRPVTVNSGEEIAFRMKEGEPPFQESLVTFRISANADGGTTLRICHSLTHTQVRTMAANTNTPGLLLAA